LDQRATVGKLWRNENGLNAKNLIGLGLFNLIPSKVAISSTNFILTFFSKVFYVAFSLVTVWLCNFLAQEYGAKAACKMLMKLITDS